MSVVVSGSGSMCRGHVDGAEDADPWFDPSIHLGRRGHKYLTEPTKYLLAATRYALERAGLADVSEEHSEERGVIVGTNWAVRKVLEEMDDTILEGGANNLQPMWAPNFSVNLPASQVSLKHRFRAFNLTVTTPQIAGLQSLELGGQSIRRERASAVVVGATDGPSASETDHDPGACVLVLEDHEAARRRGHVDASAKLAETYTGFSPDEGTDQPVVLDMIRTLLGELPSLQWCGIAGNTARADALSRALSEQLRGRRDGVELSDPITAPERFLTAAPLLAIARHGRIERPLLVTQIGDRGHLAGALLLPVGGADQ